MAGLLAKERIIAGPGFNRWLVPPAALAIHLSIGMAYGFSVFWLPLSRAIGITEPVAGDWKISTLGWMYTLFFVFLGSSAAVFGAWLERAGPRKAGVAAAFCWGGGFVNREERVSSAKAVRELGWAMRPSRDTIVDTGRSLIEFGLLRRTPRSPSPRLSPAGA